MPSFSYPVKPTAPQGADPPYSVSAQVSGSALGGPTPLNVYLPRVWAPGDIFYVWLTTGATGLLWSGSPPAGWEQVMGASTSVAGGTTSAVACFRHVAGSGDQGTGSTAEPAYYTFPLPSGWFAPQAVMAAIRGANAANPEVAWAANQTQTLAELSPPGPTGLLLGFWSDGAGNVLVVPGGIDGSLINLAADVGPGYCSCLLAAQTWPGTGATPAYLIGNGSGAGCTSAIVVSGTGFVSPLQNPGDLIYVGSEGVPANLPVGSDSEVLTVVGGVLAWAAAGGGFTNPMTTAGDIIIGGASGTPERLGIGSTGYVLTVVGGVAAWAAAVGFANPMTTAGDIIIGGASGAPTRQAIGTAYQELTVNAGATAPAWASGALATLTTTGDLLYAAAAHTMARLGIGTTGYVLAVAGGLPVWQYPALTTSLQTVTAAVPLTANTLTTILTSPSLPLGTYLCSYSVIGQCTGGTGGNFAIIVLPGTGAGVANGQGTMGSTTSDYDPTAEGVLPAVTNEAITLSGVSVVQVTTAGTFVLQAQCVVACDVEFGPFLLNPLGGTFLCFVRIA